MRLRDLPMNARFKQPGDSRGIEYIVSVPASQHQRGFVEVILVGPSSKGGFFDNVGQEVEVTYMP